MTTRSGWMRLLAVLLAMGLIAAACGDSDDDGGGDDTTTDETEAPEEGGGEEAAPPTTAGAGADDRETETGPVRGGTLVYGIEADSANPWVHYVTSCAISCRMIFKAISDPLFIATEDGGIEPYLLESAEPNEDFTSWTLTVRDGISFHDGTPLDGAAVKANIDICKASPLTGPSFTFLGDTTADGQTVTLNFIQPYVPVPALLRDEVCGYMFSPTWMETLASNPLLSEEDAAAATGDQAAPVGVGPFRFVSYTPGNGNSMVVERNDDYWRGDGPNSVTGEGLPYLDGIEFVVAVDIQGRSSGLRAGQFDIIHTANSDETSRFLDDDDFVTFAADDFGETSYTLLNVGAGENPTLAAVRGVDSLDMDPGGLNAASPLLNVNCRRALAHAVDRERLAEERNAGLAQAANGPFSPGSVGYLEDTGYPVFDIDLANAEMDICLEALGTDSIEFTFNTTNDPFNVESNTLTASMWAEAFGDRVNATIAPIEQGQYIGLALAGVFQAQGWRNHGGVDPAENWFWWSALTASPINPEAGELALNFGRFQDPAIDAAIQTILSNPDEAARTAAAEDINRAMADNVWNWWSWWTIWGVIASPSVNDITNLELPSGNLSIPVLAGKHQVAQVWCTDGECG
ncbi:MAG: ABC transporter substrate-binding protein [Actinomycetota bacterium]